MCVILSLALGYTPGSAWKRTQLLLFRWLVVSKKAEARYYCLRQELASWTLREELQPAGGTRVSRVSAVGSKCNGAHPASCARHSSLVAPELCRCTYRISAGPLAGLRDFRTACCTELTKIYPSCVRAAAAAEGVCKHSSSENARRPGKLDSLAASMSPRCIHPEQRGAAESRRNCELSCMLNAHCMRVLNTLSL